MDQEWRFGCGWWEWTLYVAGDGPWVWLGTGVPEKWDLLPNQYNQPTSLDTRRDRVRKKRTFSIITFTSSDNGRLFALFHYSLRPSLPDSCGSAGKHIIMTADVAQWLESPIFGPKDPIGSIPSRGRVKHSFSVHPSHLLSRLNVPDPPLCVRHAPTFARTLKIPHPSVEKE